MALVQPLIVSELLFAVPIPMRLRHRRLVGRDWAAMLTVVAGLVVGIVAANPEKGEPLQPFPAWWPALAAVGALALAAVLAAPRPGPTAAADRGVQEWLAATRPGNARGRPA